MTIRIGKATRTSPESWVNMQVKLDLRDADKKNHEVIAFPVKEILLKVKMKQKSAII